MTVTYELKTHSRNVNMDLNPGKPGETPIGKHTGYDLITTHDDGSQTIQYIDLYHLIFSKQRSKYPNSNNFWDKNQNNFNYVLSFIGV